MAYLKLTLLTLAMVFGSSQAIWDWNINTNNNNNNGRVVYKCFGVEVGNNGNNANNSLSEYDICLQVFVTGLILAVAGYPILNGRKLK